MQSGGKNRRMRQTGSGENRVRGRNKNIGARVTGLLFAAPVDGAGKGEQNLWLQVRHKYSGTGPV